MTDGATLYCDGHLSCLLWERDQAVSQQRAGVPAQRWSCFFPGRSKSSGFLPNLEHPLQSALRMQVLDAPALQPVLHCCTHRPSKNAVAFYPGQD